MVAENRKLAGEEPAPAAKLAGEAIKIVEKTTVRPRKLPEKGKVQLATFDLMHITIYYNQKLLVYGGGVEEFGSVVGRMKGALAEAVEEFYPLAGKLVQDEDGVMFVDCGGEGEEARGVEVVVAEAVGVEVRDLAEGDTEEEVMKMVVPYTGVMNMEGLSRPLLAVQFTKLANGIAVGCAFNHVILDGNSTWHFMISWAGLSRNEPISNPPIHDRTLARRSRVPLSLPPSASAHKLANPIPYPSFSLRSRLFSFPESSILRLKSSTNSSLPPNTKPFSTFQSLAAHAWRTISRARRLPPEAITVFVVITDCRHRVDPPIPDHYFGNLIQAVFTSVAASALLAYPPQFAAGLLQNIIDGHDDVTVKRRLEKYEENPKMFYFTGVGENCVVVGSSPRFKVYDVDFGFGMPKRVKSGNNNKFDGVMNLYPSRDGGKGIDMELTLDANVMENLEKDKEFLNLE